MSSHSIHTLNGSGMQLVGPCDGLIFVGVGVVEGDDTTTVSDHNGKKPLGQIRDRCGDALASDAFDGGVHGSENDRVLIKVNPFGQVPSTFLLTDR
jgi:hypothetical protein